MNQIQLFKIAIVGGFIGLLTLTTPFINRYVSVVVNRNRSLEYRLNVLSEYKDFDNKSQVVSQVKRIIPPSATREELLSLFPQYARQANVTLDITIDDSQTDNTQTINAPLSPVSDNGSDASFAGSPVAVGNVSSFQTVEVSLGVDGGRREIMSFINSIETSERYMKIEDLIIQYGETNADLTANITLIVYYSQTL